MFTKEDLKTQIRAMGILPTDTVLIHSSLRAVGSVENGADGIIDAFKEVLTEGLLLIPTHTWAVVGQKQPVFDVKTTVPNIGTLPRVRERIRQEAEKYPGFTVLEGLELMPHLPEYFADTPALHPNDLGFSQFAMNLYRAIRDKI